MSVHVNYYHVYACNKTLHQNEPIACTIKICMCKFLWSIHLVATKGIVSTIVVCFIPGGNDYQGRIKSVLQGKMALNITDYFVPNGIGCCLSVKDITISTIKIELRPEWSNNWYWLWKWLWVR